MAALSIAGTGNTPYTTVANPIFVLSQPEDFATGGSLVFEVLKDDAVKLTALVRVASHFALGDRYFAGTLEKLLPSKSTHSGLHYLRYKPTLRGVIKVIPEPSSEIIN